MQALYDGLRAYSDEVRRLYGGQTTTEPSYYPAVRELLIAALKNLGLPEDVRTNTSERRSGGGRDVPDVAVYDGAGDYIIVFGEVKLPEEDLESIALSTDREDQIGRYLAQTGVVLVCNVRGFALVITGDDYAGEGPVPPEDRVILDEVEFWPSAAALRRGDEADQGHANSFSDVVEQAVTAFAPIAEPETLARVLAVQARRAKEGLPARFSQAVQSLADDFGEALGITFEDEEGEEFFRSSLIQTVYYGLFAGWVLWAQDDREDDFDWHDLGAHLRIPFLGELFHELQHPRRISELGIAPRLDHATDTLSRVDRERFFTRIDLPSLGGEDDDPERAASTAIVYFYEPFLETFDPNLRKELGVWYTPPEIVRYQIRKVDRILREELDCARGFADRRVVVLDPACGTGAYLIEVLSCMAERLRSEGVGAALAATLLEAARERVFGFEILTAPFVIAHLQLRLILSSLGAELDGGDRPGVFLTNSLTGWSEASQTTLHFPELQEEHDAAQRVKQDAPIIVVLGNPPYNRFAGAALDEEQALVDHYKGIRRDADGRQIGNTELYERWGIRKQLLDELYVRFIRIAEKQIGENASHGVVCYITNNSYLTGRSHPLMRESILSNFHEIWIDNLHGNRLASERTPWGDSCQTVFSVQGGSSGIKVGTAVSTLLKREADPTLPESTSVHVRDFWGEADSKRAALVRSFELDDWSDDEREAARDCPAGPREYEKFLPEERKKWKLVPYGSVGGYDDWLSLDELFPISIQGVNPNRGLNGSVIDTDRDALIDRMQDYFSDESFEVLEGRYPELCQNRARYDAKETRDSLRERAQYDPNRVQPYALFPLDGRFIYYETREKLLNESRPDLWRSREGNEFLIAVPQARRESETIPLYATSAFDLHLHDRGSVGFPRFLNPDERPAELFDGPDTDRPLANLSESFWTAAAEAWELTGTLFDDDAHALAGQVLRASLALTHSPEYQVGHRDSLKHDWAHVPLPKSAQLLEELDSIGQNVACLLDPFADPSGVVRDVLGAETEGQLGVIARTSGGPVNEGDLVVEISYYGSARGRWEKRPWSEQENHVALLGDVTGDLYLNDQVFLRNVPQAVWRFELGGYPVVKKWLGYRHQRYRSGAPLSLTETETLSGIVKRIAALLILHPSLDELYSRAAEDPWTADDLTDD